MATLISRATGNFTSAGTWETYDATSYLDSNSASTAISTSNLDSATFIPGAITVSGVALKLAARIASPTGTFTVTLRNSTAGSDLASLTVNVSDLPYYTNTGNQSRGLGWVFFKFASSATLNGGDSYLIRVVCSNTGSQVTLYRNATSNNWCRVLATTTTAAPASGDQLFIIGERTGTGTGNDFTVTLDNTATTSFGPTVSGGPPEGIVIGQGGTLASGTTAATAYYFKWKGFLHVTGGGLLQLGTVGTPIPADSTVTMYADSASNADSGILVDSGGTLNGQGATKNPWSYLTATAAAAATTITVASTSGWRNNDLVGFGPGNVTITETEQRTASTIDSSTQITLSSGLTNQKRGVTPHQTWIANITRNIIFTGASSSLRGFLTLREVCAGTLRYAMFSFWGTNTVGLYGVDLQMMAAGTFTMEYCAFDSGTSSIKTMYLNTSKTGSFTFRYNVIYRPGNGVFYSNGESATALTMTDNLAMGMQDNATYWEFNLLPTSGTSLSRNIMTGAGGSTAYGIACNIGTNVRTYFVTGMFDGLHGSYLGSGTLFLSSNNQNNWYGTIDTMTSYMNSGTGIYLFCYFGFIDLLLKNYTAWSNSNSGILLTHSGGNRSAFTRIVVEGGTMAGSSLQSQPYGLQASVDQFDATFKNVDFGITSGIFATHTNGDVYWNTTQGMSKLLLNGCTLNSTTKITGFTGGTNRLYDIYAQQYNVTDNDHRRDVKVSPSDSWTSRVDTVIYNTASPSEKLTPTIPTSGIKGVSSSFFTSVNDTATKTINVYVRKSEAGDGAAYTGNQPRLIQKANPSIGLDTDVVLDTMTAATGSWEQLTGTTAAVTDNGVIECYVDFDGSAGWINVDDWS
jgi:hypothetical protein